MTLARSAGAGVHERHHRLGEPELKKLLANPVIEQYTIAMVSEG